MNSELNFTLCFDFTEKRNGRVLCNEERTLTSDQSIKKAGKCSSFMM